VTPIIPLSSLLIQISSLRRINNVFTSVIYKPLDLISRYLNNRVLSKLRPSSMTRLVMGSKHFFTRIHRTRKPFYITSRRQRNPALRENYASELHQVMILRLSRVGRTSYEQMVGYGRVHYTLFQNIILLCMKN
jgi:hypothetical protein